MKRTRDRIHAALPGRPTRGLLFGTVRFVDRGRQHALVESSNDTMVTCQLSRALAKDLARNVGIRVTLVVSWPSSLTDSNNPAYVIHSISPPPSPGLRFDAVHWLLKRHNQYR